MDKVNEIWENQRWYGIGWCAPSPLLLSQLAGISDARPHEADTGPAAIPVTPPLHSRAKMHDCGAAFTCASAMLPAGSLRGC